MKSKLWESDHSDLKLFMFDKHDIGYFRTKNDEGTDDVDIDVDKADLLELARAILEYYEK